jgi:hypothetical protein
VRIYVHACVSVRVHHLQPTYLPRNVVVAIVTHGARTCVTAVATLVNATLLADWRVRANEHSFATHVKVRLRRTI